MHQTIEMHENTQFMHADPDWQGRPRRRLGFSMLLAALLVAGALSLLRFPVVELSAGIAELIVQIVEPEPVAPDENTAAPPPEPLESLTDPEPEQTPELSVETAEIPAAATDWQALSEKTAQDIVENQSPAISVNPVFDERRRVAAEQFRASQAPEKKFIWDNVEKDYLGRTILRSGDCYRVLDDPSAVNREIFETFTQYFVFCGGGKYVGRELPWVADVRERHTYLQRQRDMREGAMLD